jgi:hypothetical protein
METPDIGGSGVGKMPHGRESGCALGRKRRRNVKPLVVEVEVEV